MFNLSVVNIVPDTHKDAINQIAALYDCGENNLSVKLIDSNGAVFWGCHSWWKPEDYAEFTDAEKRAEMFAAYPVEQQAVFNAALNSLYERIVLDGNPTENCTAAYTALGLSIVEPSL